ncbi:hypothetical protein APHAL10511_003397 [Amanita phalloides]|nr:hypothetical protein APHAL10511_003397 [Amanita phalloides]
MGEIGLKGRKPIKFTDLQDMMWVLKSFKKVTALLPNLVEQAFEAEEFVQSAMLGLGLKWDPEALDIHEEDAGKVENLWWCARANLDPNDLMDAEAVKQTLNMYVEYFSQGEEEQFELDIVQAGTLWDKAMEGYMGVEEMSKKSMEELSGVLSFQEDWPFIWNHFKQMDNVSNVWEAARADGELYVQGGEGMELVWLLWHQLAGVVVMVSKVWVAEGKKMFRAMLADDVGVGKTVQVMAMIAFTQLMYECEQQKQLRPVLISK